MSSEQPDALWLKRRRIQRFRLGRRACIFGVKETTFQTIYDCRRCPPLRCVAAHGVVDVHPRTGVTQHWWLISAWYFNISLSLAGCSDGRSLASSGPEACNLCTLYTFPARSSERHFPLYVSNTARGNVRDDDRQVGTLFTPNSKIEITVRALTAAGFCKSYEFTVVRGPSLPVHAPASPALTVVSLDAGVLVVSLSFHDGFRTK